MNVSSLSKYIFLLHGALEDLPRCKCLIRLVDALGGSSTVQYEELGALRRPHVRRRRKCRPDSGSDSNADCSLERRHSLRQTPAPNRCRGNIARSYGRRTTGDRKMGNGEHVSVGNPVQTGATFYFDLKQKGRSCGRNQMGLLPSTGATLRLTPGKVHTGSLVTSMAAAQDQASGMGMDKGEA